MEKLSSEEKRLLETPSVKWYFSMKGKNAYNGAKSYAAKLKFVYSYLCALSGSVNGVDVILKKRFAYLITECALSQELPFSGYPDIFQEKNPFVVRFIRYILSESRNGTTSCYGKWDRGLAHDLINDIYDAIPDPEKGNYYYRQPVMITERDPDTDELQQKPFHPAYTDLLMEKGGNYTEYIVLNRMVIWFERQGVPASEFGYGISRKY